MRTDNSIQFGKKMQHNFELSISKQAFSSDMSGGAILRDFSKMAISRDLGRVRRRAYTHFKAEIRGFRLIWVSSPNSL